MFRASRSISNKIRPRVLPRLERRLQAGEAVDFGPHITISQRGIQWVKNKLGWPAVEVIRIVNRGGQAVLHLETQPRVIDVDLSAIPNLHILLEMVQQFRIPVGAVGESRLP
jgi:hypothetical protein